MSVLNDMKSFKTSLFDIDAVEDNFQHWDIILNFLKQYLIKIYKSCFWMGCLETFNYKIYPFPVNKTNNLYVFYTINSKREEIEIYFDKPKQNSIKMGWIDKPNKRLNHIFYKGNAIRYNDLIEMIYECT